jgi:hypothetical protein
MLAPMNVRSTTLTVARNVRKRAELVPTNAERWLDKAVWLFYQ